jgi:hypothetical protein
MAKELPYFKFETSEWDNGTIQMCSRESKGLFIDLCSMYWARLGDVKTKLAVQKLCNGNANALQELIEEEIIYVIEDKIIIHFLDYQLKEFNAVSDKRKKAANKRWEQDTDKQDVNASALQVQSKSNAIREEKIREDKNKIPTFIEFRDYAIENKPLANIKDLKLKYDSWVANGWKDGNNKKIVNWKSKILNTLPFIKESTDTPVDQYAAHMRNLIRP